MAMPAVLDTVIKLFAPLIAVLDCSVLALTVKLVPVVGVPLALALTVYEPIPPVPVPNATMYKPAVTLVPVISIPTLSEPELTFDTFSVVVANVPVNNA
jgi:hypothetical protein